MSFLICFSNNPPHDHAQNKAIYLDQKFYEQIVSICSQDNQYIMIRKIAQLKYKSPILIILKEDIPLLNQELKQLIKINSNFHDFSDVCEQAMRNDQSLTISGDMYQELPLI